MTDQEKQEIINLYSSGLTIKQVSRRTACGISTIRNLLKKLNIIRSKKTDDLTERKIIEEFKSGASQRSLHLKYELTRATIKRILNRNNIEVKPFDQVKLSEEEIEIFCKIWISGMPGDKILNHYKISDATLNRWVKKLNLPLRREVPSGKKHNKWKGGRIINGSGYISIWVAPNDPFFSMTNRMGYVPEHRYVMAKHLNRILTKNETVHHIDGDKTNNKIENLQLRIGNHGTGQSYCCAECGSLKLKPVELK